jgi:hypothetical protein
MKKKLIFGRKKNPGGASAQTGSGSATSFAKKQKDKFSLRKAVNWMN